HGGGITAGDDGGGGLAGVVIHDARLVVALRLVGHGGGESGGIEMVGDEIGLIGGNAQTAGAVGFGAGMSAHGSDGRLQAGVVGGELLAHAAGTGEYSGMIDGPKGFLDKTQGGVARLLERLVVGIDVIKVE